MMRQKTYLTTVLDDKEKKKKIDRQLFDAAEFLSASPDSFVWFSKENRFRTNFLLRMHQRSRQLHVNSKRQDITDEPDVIDGFSLNFKRDLFLFAGQLQRITYC